MPATLQIVGLDFDLRTRFCLKGSGAQLPPRQKNRIYFKKQYMPETYSHTLPLAYVPFLHFTRSLHLK